MAKAPVLVAAGWAVRLGLVAALVVGLTVTALLLGRRRERARAAA